MTSISDGSGPTVLMISPSFPADTVYFTRALARVGATVIGVGDQSVGDLDPGAAGALTGYLQLDDLWNEDHTVDRVVDWLSFHRAGVDRVECLWEPGVVLAAKLRARLGLDGITVDQAHVFRDKDSMKQVLDSAGVRTPHHYRATTRDGVREAAATIGHPVVVKPIAGAGSADTYIAGSGEELERVLELVAHVDEVSVEEYIQGEEFTYDTICADGRIVFENVCWYRPKPLVTRLNPWISQTAVCLRDLDRAPVAAGVALGRRVLEVLDFGTGFTHMEWFATASGQTVFGEIGARSPGGRLPHGMNYCADIDVFTGWAEAVCHGTLSQDVTKRFNAALVFKRAVGDGSHITAIDGLDRLLAEYGEHMPVVDLVRPGEPRRDWRQVVTGDGWMVVRHPNLDMTLTMADRLASEVRVLAE